MDAAPSAPLAGLKVIELAAFWPVPGSVRRWPISVRCHQGGKPGGDDTRGWGPPFIEIDGEKSAAYFHACNRGKRSVIADFGKPEDREFVLALLNDADVVIENFKVGGLKKFVSIMKA